MKTTIKILSLLAAVALVACEPKDADLKAPAGDDHLTDTPIALTVGAIGETQGSPRMANGECQTPNLTPRRAGYTKGELINSGSLTFWIDQLETKYDAKHLEINYQRGEWVPMGTLIWRNGTDVATYAAVYPHQRNSNGVYNITVPTEQTNENIKATEILYATGTAKGEDGAINIVFEHTLAQLKVNLTFGEIVGTDVEVKSVRLSNAALSGTFTAWNDNHKCEWSNQSNSGVVTLIKNSNTEFECLLVPQILADYTITVVAEVNGAQKAYRFQATTSITLEQGATYSIPVQVGADPYVDLGLPTGTLWAKCNVGATTPEEAGDLFAWGETTPMKSPYGWEVYKWGSADNQLTKYCTDAAYGKNGFVDNLLALEIADDAARAQWGQQWLMPTEEQINELRNECTWEHYTLNGIKGYRGTGKNGNTIFFPFTTYYEEDGQSGATDGTYYWSATLDDYYTPCAHALFFSTVRVNILNASISRSYACPIRAVYGK